MKASLQVHATEPRSRANGPGVRFAIWVQGCTLACPGCFNPETHVLAAEKIRLVSDLIAEVQEQGAAIEGVTISGGEPLQQPEGLCLLVEGLRHSTGLSILLFSGYRREEIESLPLGPRILASIDVLVDGRYQARERVGRHLRGSSNQQAHFLTARYTDADLHVVPEAEVHIASDGSIRVSGVAPVILKDRQTGEPSD